MTLADVTELPAVIEFGRATNALALELPHEVWLDFTGKVAALLAEVERLRAALHRIATMQMPSPATNAIAWAALEPDGEVAKWLAALEAANDVN